MGFKQNYSVKNDLLENRAEKLAVRLRQQRGILLFNTDLFHVVGMCSVRTDLIQPGNGLWAALEGTFPI